MKLAKRLLLLIALILFLLIAVVLIRTLTTTSRQIDVPALPPLPIDVVAVSERLGAAVRFRTISTDQGPDAGGAELVKLQAWLTTEFPLVHRHLQREVVAEHSLLYTWPGSDAQLKPLLLMAHQDVVPIAPGTEAKWTVPPFDGVRKDGFVWGRGAWDDKGNLLGELEAIERLLADGFKPRRTVLLAFGHDEEIGGKGAQAIAALLKSRGVRLEFVLDEGMLLTEGIVPGVKPTVALIGIAEKGYLTVEVKAETAPGHSSMPPMHGKSAIAMLSAALIRLDSNQFPAQVSGVAREMFDTVTPEMDGLLRVALSNLWLFEPMVRAKLEATASTNAMLRTTTALTMTHAGNKENVLPGVAQATVNFRLLPGDTRETVVEHVKTTVGEPLKVQAGAGFNPSKVAPTASASYLLINRTVREVFPGTVVAPGLMLAATDSRHFEELSDHIYKFSPIRANTTDLARFHGTDERIAEAGYTDLIRFYHRLVHEAAK